MSETGEPKEQAEQPAEQSSGAEAPAPSSQAPPAQPAAPPPPAEPAAPAQPPQPKRPARTVNMWLAAAVAAVLLVGGGLGGYFIGAANDNDHRPGFGTFRDHSPGDRDGFRDGPPPRWLDGGPGFDR